MGYVCRRNYILFPRYLNKVAYAALQPNDLTLERTRGELVNSVFILLSKLLGVGVCLNACTTHIFKTPRKMHTHVPLCFIYFVFYLYAWGMGGRSAPLVRMLRNALVCGTIQIYANATKVCCDVTMTRR